MGSKPIAFSGGAHYAIVWGVGQTIWFTVYASFLQFSETRAGPGQYSRGLGDAMTSEGRIV